MNTKWTHTPQMSICETGAVVLKEDDGWSAFPQGGDGGASGTYKTREDAIAAVDWDRGARLCCAESSCSDRPEEDTPFSLGDAQTLESTRVFQGFFAVDRYRLRHRVFAGGWSQPIQREIFERGHAVAVILHDPKRDLLVFVEQFRPGTYAALKGGNALAGGTPWLLECVAGIVEEGEHPEDVARREAFEEAHCTVQTLTPVHRFFVSPGGSSESVALYYAPVQAPEDGTLHGLAEEHEDIRVRCIKTGTACAWLEQGRFNNALTLIAMQWFALNRDTLNRF